MGLVPDIEGTDAYRNAACLAVRLICHWAHAVWRHAFLPWVASRLRRQDLSCGIKRRIMAGGQEPS